MSLLVWPVSKLPLSKKPFSSRFSTATTSRSKPYLLLSAFNFNFYDPTTNKEVVTNLKIQDQSQTCMNLKQSTRPIGSSRGYLAIKNIKDSSIDLVEIDSQLKKRKIISLPPLHFDDEDDDVKKVSVSSPVNGSDVIVAVKFYGSRLSLLRVGDSEWTEIDIPIEFSFDYSSVIYSERDERFYLNNDELDCTDPIDLTPKSGLVTPPVIGYPFPISNVPEEYKKFLKSRPASAYGGSEEQLVESPSGQLFLVAWASYYVFKRGEMENEKATQMIVVYKQDEDEEGEICSYTATKDIGDLCIFMGENEAFCVSASDYPGLKPNSVYFACHISGVGIWDLSSQTILYLRDGLQCSTMCWIPPTTTPILKS